MSWTFSIPLDNESRPASPKFETDHSSSILRYVRTGLKQDQTERVNSGRAESIDKTRGPKNVKNITQNQKCKNCGD